MGFVIKSAFWLSLALLAIPLDTGSAGDAQSAVGPFQAVAAMREAVGDIGRLCERQPDVCDTGRAAFKTIAARAGEASRLALDYLDDTSADPDANLTADASADEPAAEDSLTTGSVPRP